MNKIWQKWLHVSIKLMHILADILLTIIYILFVIPLSFFIRIFSKNTLLGHGYNPKKNSYWMRREKVAQTIAWAREQ